ncbi:alpha/beta hydrolase family esterase [Dictyobacter kobayashii]|uniref:Hydrolase n=1 Tax=Dictyobacter kobayashii TaxID=2014872 RepID=A0A402AAW1_9CHLR|nr:PHB depolymerase family esterase [Dictyobacter kobayashii]GCE16313.1 hydrolase [Dictyobacter kobayashii]
MHWMRQKHASLVVVLLWLCCLAVSGCMPASTQTPQSSSSTASQQQNKSSCTRSSPVQAGTTQNQAVAAQPAVARGQHTRTYLVHVPIHYTSRTPVPVVIVFHGHGGTASGTEQGTGFSQLADKEHFIAVYPQGLPDDQQLPMWASIGLYDYNIDETAFMNDMLNKLTADFCIDTQRIYATGFSNGGGMSGFVACQLSTRIAAVAPIAGNYYPLQAGCHPKRAVPLLEIHGTNDTVVPYNGISAKIDPQWPLPAVQDWLHAWAQRDGCTQGPEIFFQDKNATGFRWAGCRQNATILHYRIERGGHSIPAMIAKLPTEQVIWNFFKLHSLSGLTS